MIGKPSVFSIFLLLCLLPVFTAAGNVSGIAGDKFEEIPGRGLEIRTNPAGVRVFIDGVERALTPAVYGSLGPGDHHVRLNREGYAERILNITLFSGSRLVISIEMEELRGQALVSIHKTEGSPDNIQFNPQISVSALDENNASVSLSNDFNALLNLPVGYHTIKARAFGWEDTSVTVLVSGQNTVSADIIMRPAEFRIYNISQSRRRFNPMNSSSLGVIEFSFEVSSHGSAAVTVTDKNGVIVHQRNLNDFDSWLQSFTWDGKDSGGNPLPEGHYTVAIEAVSTAENSGMPVVQVNMEADIDYSAVIFPLSLAGGIPGLSFAPHPLVLPAGSYQIEANVIYTPNPFGFPFGIGLRFSPYNKFEISALFNINPNISDSLGWGITGSLKYNILDGRSFPLALSAGVLYTFAVDNGEVPLSPGRGVGAFIPISLEIEMFSVVFSPYVFWRTSKGSVPALLLSGGVLYREKWFNAGLSVRAEIYFKDDEKPKIFAGAEMRFFPSPSNFVFSINGGIWTQNSNTGFFGGIGIGLLY